MNGAENLIAQISKTYIALLNAKLRLAALRGSYNEANDAKIARLERKILKLEDKYVSLSAEAGVK